MNPDPKPESLRYDKYTKWIRTLKSCVSGLYGTVKDQVINCHMRCMKSGGTSLKPNDFHQLPALDSEHKSEHTDGYLMDMDTATDKILSHLVGYLMNFATPHQKKKVANLIGQYIKENKI